MEKETFAAVTIGTFQEELASKAPVPGGGGVAALTGALAASLLTMVGNLTVGKKKYAAAEPEIRALMERTKEAAEKLLRLVDEDARAFAPLSAAYSLPKETAEQQAKKDRVMEQCLRDAAAVPMQIMEETADVITMIGTFREKGSVLAVSDAGCSAALAAAALRCAALNVLVNTRLMKDRSCAEELNAKCDGLLAEYLPLAEENFAGVQTKLHEAKR